MGGGPSSEQKAAAASQANLTNQLGDTAKQQEQFFEKQQNAVNPFYTSRMQGGLPYYGALTDAQSGINAQAFAPARANLYRQLGSQPGLPNGFRQQALTDLDSQQARSYDQNLVGTLAAQEQAKQAGAAGLIGQAQIANPMGYYSGALQGNQSILQAPLQRPGLAGVLGGLASGAGSAAGGFLAGR
jgi:hypothetical protein